MRTPDAFGDDEPTIAELEDRAERAADRTIEAIGFLKRGIVEKEALIAKHPDHWQIPSLRIEVAELERMVLEIALHTHEVGERRVIDAVRQCLSVTVH